MYGYKLMRERKDGTVGPLFINKRAVLPFDVWLEAEDVPTPGYKHRPGWHILPIPHAPHLSEIGRVWVYVEFEDFETIERPASQGECWFLAKRMRLVRKIECSDSLIGG